jgi:hypothetical protein
MDLEVEEQSVHVSPRKRFDSDHLLNELQPAPSPCTGVADDLLLLSPEDIVVATIIGVDVTPSQGNNSLFVNQQQQQQKQSSILKALIFSPMEPKISNNNSRVVSYFYQDQRYHHSFQSCFSTNHPRRVRVTHLTAFQSNHETK